MRDDIIVVDFGSQFTQLIIKKIRSIGCYARVVSNTDELSNIATVKAFIVSGSPHSVNEIPKILEKIIKINFELKTPVLGICYGAQLICKYFSGSVSRNSFSEFGSSEAEAISDSPLIHGVWQKGKKYNVWSSHSDSIVSLPSDFNLIASGCNGKNISIFSNELRKIYGIQFHPEVDHTPDGIELLKNFFKISGCDFSWNPKTFSSEIIATVREKIQNEKVIMAVSGGVDSTVTAKIISAASPGNISCIFVNTGLMRKGEPEKISNVFKNIGIELKIVDKSEMFVDRLKGISDPEKKRKIIGKAFIDAFEEESQHHSSASFLAQGTLYSDVIESGFASTHKESKIKSHHNVGGLPKNMKLKLIEPLRELFKDEVRVLGKELGIPDEILGRHPFPGPGIAIRVIGSITKEKVRILQEIDDIFINVLCEYGLYNEIWQAFAVLLPTKSVGVKGDSRSYGYVCCLRCVNSSDGMTASVFPIADVDSSALFWKCLMDASNKIINNVKEITRVTYDITSKPPGTIEWE